MTHCYGSNLSALQLKQNRRITNQLRDRLRFTEHSYNFNGFSQQLELNAMNNSTGRRREDIRTVCYTMGWRGGGGRRVRQERREKGEGGGGRGREKGKGEGEGRLKGEGGVGRGKGGVGREVEGGIQLDE